MSDHCALGRRGATNGRRFGAGRREDLLEPVEPLLSRLERRRTRAELGGTHAADELDHVPQVIERDQRVELEPLRVGEVGVAAVALGHLRLEARDHSVREVADPAADERRQPRVAREGLLADERAEAVERPLLRPVLGLATVPDRDRPSPLLDPAPRPEPDEGEAPPALAALGRLEEDCVRLVADAEEEADRSALVVAQLAKDGDGRTLLREAVELGARRRGGEIGTGGGFHRGGLTLTALRPDPLDR